MKLSQYTLSVVATALLAPHLLAQTNFPETEPNSQKSEATAVTGIVAGDTITGVSTANDTTLGLTTDASADVYRVKTSALTPGVYKHRLAITSGIAGHEGTIRGRNQTGTVGTGGTPGTVDIAAQFTSTFTTPARFNQWYGFGSQEEIYYRVTGTVTTTVPYTATLSTTPVTPGPIAPSFETGAISISTVGQTTADTEIFVYDSNFVAIPGFLNDDEPTPGTTSRSKLNRTFAAGTYYLAVSSINCGTNEPAAADDRYVIDNLLDFPNCIERDSTSTSTADWDFTITATNGTWPQTNQLAANAPYEITWYTFNVATGSPPIVSPPPANDNCAGATSLGAGGTISGSMLGATNDGAASCDPGGAASKDVWYSFTNTAIVPRVLSVNTCTSTFDTVLSIYGSCGGAELACSDDCGGVPCASTSSCISGLVLNPSQTVLIRVSDKGLGGLSYTLASSTAGVPPPNDNCATPIVLAAPGLYPVDNSAATAGTEGQANGAICAVQGGAGFPRDVWYTYTPTTSGTVTVSTCGLIPVPPSPSSDSKIAIYAGAGCPMAIAIACNDDSGEGGSGPTCPTPNGFNSTVNFTATCGTTYTIQIGMWYLSSSSILGQFSVAESGPPCATPTTAYCSGDGTDTACPCANPGLPGRGCNNTVSSGGAGLTSSGIASITADTLVLSGNNAVPFGPGLYYQGSTPAAAGPPFGVTFGHGLRCAGGMTPRLEIRGADGTGASSTTVPIHVLGSDAAGDVRYYQLWYRDSPLFGTCTIGFNLSSALSLTWAP